MNKNLYGCEEAYQDALLLVKNIPKIHQSKLCLKIADTNAYSDHSATEDRSHGVDSSINEYGKLLRQLLFAHDALQSECRQHGLNAGAEHAEQGVDTMPTIYRVNDLLEAQSFYNSQQFPFVVPGSLVRNPADLTDVINQPIPEAALKQLKKDIERDKLMINGKLHLGSEVGLEGIEATISEIIFSLLNECSLPPQSTNVASILATAVLYRTSRTISGGMAVTVLQSFVNLTEHLIIPQPDLTPPLNISIRLGNAARLQSLPWGVVCEISCEYMYVLKRLEMAMSVEDSGAPGHGNGEQQIKLTYTHVISYGMDLTENQANNLDRIVDSPTAHTMIKVETNS